MSDAERGVALIVTLMAILLLSAMAAGLILTTTANTLITANGGAAIEAYYGAEAAFERTMAELKVAPTFTPVLSGATGSMFVDGSPSGTRTLPDGAQIDLVQIVNMANCARQTGCTDAEMSAATGDRPWGVQNPRWRLFSYGTLDSAAQTGWSGFPLYVVSLIADDPSESDGDPWQDGVRTGATANPGAGVLWVRAEAFGRRGAHRIVEGAVVRLDLAAAAQWEAADPLTRGTAPPAIPLMRRLALQEVR